MYALFKALEGPMAVGGAMEVGGTRVVGGVQVVVDRAVPPPPPPVELHQGLVVLHVVDT